MRKLTFGILAISIGIMAALPFRRYQSIPDASIVPDEATGPTQSSLSGTTMEMLVNEEPRVIENLQSLALTPRPTLSLPSDHNRSLAIPKMYSQVAVPLEQVAANEDDFNATTPVRAKMERKRQALSETVASDVQSLAVKTPKEKVTKRIAKKKKKNDSKSFGAAFARGNADPPSIKSERLPKSRHAKPETNAKLASSTSADSDERLEQLPATKDEPGRQRHWIRQP